MATHNCGIEAQNGATEVCTQVVAEVHPLDEEQDQIKKSLIRIFKVKRRILICIEVMRIRKPERALEPVCRVSDTH